MKRILIYGATGRTGSLVLHYALQQGYEVTALVRDASQLTGSPRLRIISGLTTELSDVKTAMRGCGAVISTLGALHQSELLPFSRLDPPHTIEISMRHTIQCMKEQGIRRIITQSTFGAGDSYRFAQWFLRMAMKYTRFGIVQHDHNMQEQLLMESGLDWTIVRPVGLDNNDKSRKLCLTYDAAPPGRSVSRRQVAKFMVDCMDEPSYFKRAPIVSECDGATPFQYLIIATLFALYI
jgi:putative NADH-flavin reductase